MNTREGNEQILLRLSAFLQVGGELDPALVREIARTCRVSEVEAALQLLGAELGLDTDRPEDRRLMSGWLRPGFRALSRAEFLRDAYLRQIRFEEVTEGLWQMTHLFFAPFEVFVRDDLEICPDGRELVPVGTFREAVTYPAILQNGRVWMTVNPLEIASMKPLIRAAAGHVVLYGLGLGYCLFHLLKKHEVQRVTVVEKDPDVIRLFRRHLLPQFPGRDRVNIVCEDAIAYAEHLPGDTDMVFGDIWHDALDGTPLYLGLKAREVPGVRYLYWMENLLQARIRYLAGLEENRT